MLGLSFLQELYNLDDQRALDSLAFDVRWQYALGLEPETAYLSRRSLVDFRSRLAAVDPEMSLLRSVFDKIGDGAIAELGISIKEQRIDSALIASNIFTRGRVELFRKTLLHFLQWLENAHPDKVQTLSKELGRWFEESKKDGWFGKLDQAKARTLINEYAAFLYELVQAFSSDEAVLTAEPYQLVERLFNEQCVVETEDKDGEPTDGNGSLAGSRSDVVKVKNKLTNPGSSLQSPYDPDAGCSYKGPGYFAHVTETCNNTGSEIITDFCVVSAAETDRGKDVVTAQRLIDSGKKPETLFADAGYPTGQGLVDAARKGIEIVAPFSKGRLPEGTIGRDQFAFDTCTGLCISCPAGQVPTRHALRSTYRRKPPTLHAYFDGEHCRSCPMLNRCIARKPNNGKKGDFHLEVEAKMVARDAALAAQKSDEWWDRYAIRAGVEATVSELARSHGLKKLRVRRMPKVKMAVSFKVTACNIKRWLRSSGALSFSKWAVSRLLMALVATENLFLQRESQKAEFFTPLFI